MAIVCAASPTAVTALLSSSVQTSSPALRSATSLAVPSRQVQNGDFQIRASSEEHCSRREAMTVVGGAGLAGLLLLPVGTAEARIVNPGVRRKLKEELDKLKKESDKTTEVVKKKVEGVTKAAPPSGAPDNIFEFDFSKAFERK